MTKTEKSRALGDKGEQYIADMVTAAGIPAALCRVNNPGFDVVTPRGTIQVKTKSPTHPHPAFRFPEAGYDWLALIIADGDAWRTFIMPRDVAIAHVLDRKTPIKRGRRIGNAALITQLARWENNFALAGVA